MDDPRDVDLWRQVASGDERAFEALFLRYGKRVYNYCFRRTGSWAIAEDLTSSVFLEAWRKRTTLELTGSSLLPWLLGTATNLARNLQRGTIRGEKAVRRLPDPGAVPDFADEVAERADEERLMREVLNLLSELPKKDQEVVHLSVWSGLSHAEVADMLGEPIGTIKSRLSRAKARLRELANRDEAPTGREGSRDE